MEAAVCRDDHCCLLHPGLAFVALGNVLERLVVGVEHGLVLWVVPTERYAQLLHVVDGGMQVRLAVIVRGDIGVLYAALHVVGEGLQLVG